MPDSQRPHGLQPTRLFRPWDFPGKNTGVGCHCLLHLTHEIGLRKEIKVTLIGKEVKLSLFADVMIVYIKNLQKLLGLMSKLSSSQHTRSMDKHLLYSYILALHNWETKIKNTIPFTITSKKVNN